MITESKICIQCSIERSIDLFNNGSKSKKYGQKCKICLKENKIKQDKVYYALNKDKIKIKNKKFRQENKEKIKQQNKNYYENNKSLILSKQKQYVLKNELKTKRYNKIYYVKNKNKLKQNQKRYFEKNKKHINNYKNNWRKLKYKEVSSFRLESFVRRSVNLYIKDKATKSYKLLENLPYTIQELKKHLESLFEPWMNWENYGVYRKLKWDDNDKSTWKWHIDHIIPQSKLPYNSLKDENFKKCWALENLRPLSAKENLIKGNKLIIMSSD
jgi:hypothetical protein